MMLKSQPTNLSIATNRLSLSYKMVEINQILFFTIIMALVFITTTTAAVQGNMIRSLSTIMYLLTEDYSTS